MDDFLDICTIEIYLVEADRKIKARVWKAEHVPGNRAQLAHLIDVEASINLEDRVEYIVKDITAIKRVARGIYARLAWEGTFWRERKQIEVVIISASRADVVDVLDVRVVERETGSC
jgi:hypothetical protein